MRTSQSSIPSDVLSAVRESLMVSLSVALASFLMVGLAHAQQPATPPEQYKGKNFGGDAIAMNLLPAAMRDDRAWLNEDALYIVAGNDKKEDFAKHVQLAPGVANPQQLGHSQIGGVIMDPTGAVIPNAQVKVTSEKGITQTVNTDSEGNWVVNGMPSGKVKIEAGARVSKLRSTTRRPMTPRNRRNTACRSASGRCRKQSR